MLQFHYLTHSILNITLHFIIKNHVNCFYKKYYTLRKRFFEISAFQYKLKTCFFLSYISQEDSYSVKIIVKSKLRTCSSCYENLESISFRNVHKLKHFIVINISKSQTYSSLKVSLNYNDNISLILLHSTKLPLVFTSSGTVHHFFCFSNSFDSFLFSTLSS